jgi:hypothetical protein
MMISISILIFIQWHILDCNSKSNYSQRYKRMRGRPARGHGAASVAGSGAVPSAVGGANTSERRAASVRGCGLLPVHQWLAQQRVAQREAVNGDQAVHYVNTKFLNECTMQFTGYPGILIGEPTNIRGATR